MFSFRDLDPLFDLYILKVNPSKQGLNHSKQKKQGAPFGSFGKGRIGHVVFVWDLQISELASKKVVI